MLKNKKVDFENILDNYINDVIISTHINDVYIYNIFFKYFEYNDKVENYFRTKSYNNLFISDDNHIFLFRQKSLK